MFPVKKALLVVPDEASYASTGWVFQVMYDGTQCAVAIHAQGVAVSTCFTDDDGAYYKYQLVQGNLACTLSQQSCAAQVHLANHALALTSQTAAPVAFARISVTPSAPPSRALLLWMILNLGALLRRMMMMLRILVNSCAATPPCPISRSWRR
jgi:hypothetical protein